MLITTRRFLPTCSLLLILLLSPYAHAEVHSGQELEVAYAEAVIAFNSKNYRGAVTILNSLLKMQPASPEALELKALSQKTLGDERGSLETYQRLIKVKPESERGPYYFEAGSILYKSKKYSDAKRYLERSLGKNFNPAASLYFLGSMELEQERFDKAESYFSHLTSLDPKEVPAELRTVAHYYLGLIYLKSGSPTLASGALAEARTIARKNPGNKTAAEVGAAADRALKPYENGHWFGNIALLTQWDGNVSLVSTTSDAASSQASGKETIKEMLIAGAGWVSSPLDTIQWLTSYRLLYNKNFNRNAAEYEFMSHIPSLYMTLNALSETNYGMKLEGNYTFQNRLDSGGSNRALRPYNLSVEIGPFLKTLIAPRHILTTELGVKPQKYYTDADSGTARRGGTAFALRSALKYESKSTLYNPEASLGYERNATQGTDYQAHTFAVSLSNSFKLPGRHLVKLGLDTSYSKYSARIPARSDLTYGLRLNWIREMNAHFALLGEASYTQDKSNLPDLYSYKRPTVSFGLSYTF